MSEATDKLLLLTATPHQGDVDQFAHLLRLIDTDQFIDVVVGNRKYIASLTVLNKVDFPTFGNPTIPIDNDIYFL